MSSDEEELAQLRQQRTTRHGVSKASQLLEKQERLQQQAEKDSTLYYESGQPPGRLSGGDAGSQPFRAAADDDDDDDEDAPVVVLPSDDPSAGDDLMHTGARAHLPMAFGKQEPKVKPLQEVHSKNVRKAGVKFGPPRPPPRSTTAAEASQPGTTTSQADAKPPNPQGGKSFGPLRPPKGGVLVGPPGPPVRESPGERDGAGAESSERRDDTQIESRVGGGEEAELVGPSRPPFGGEEEEGGEDNVGPPRPPQVEDDEDSGLVGPARPPADDSDDEDDEDEDDDPYHLPITHEVIFKGHNRIVTALAIDHNGARMLSGSYDYTLKMYDFNGMKSDLKPFRELEPSDGHPVHSVSWSPSGELFLVVTGSSQPRVYDRDGHLRCEFPRGDMYIRDMKNTKGHVCGCCVGAWHPAERYTCMTSSDDGTVRLWDASEGGAQKTVVKPALAKPGRVAVTSCSFNGDGRLLAAGLKDGTIQIWSVGGKFGSSAAIAAVPVPNAQMVDKQRWTFVSRAKQLIRGAHTPDTEISCVTFSQDDHTLISRAMDDTMKVWDLRKFTEPLKVFAGLPSSYPMTNAIFSPDESLMLTGTAAGSKEEGGAVVFVDKRRLEVVRRVGMPSNVASVIWHHRLNQIFVGIGDRKSGGIRGLYDTTFSERGVMLCAARQPRQASPFDFQPPLMIKAPHALPMFREDTSRKRLRDKDRSDPLKTRRPDPGMAMGIGKQGRIGTTKTTLLTQHLLKQKGKLVAVDQEMDPREALLRHAEKPGEFSTYMLAYEKTQPKPIYAVDEEEEQ